MDASSASETVVESGYDSRHATLKHISRVSELMDDVAVRLRLRGVLHDASKLKPPEKGAFDRLGEASRAEEFGGPAYHAALQELRPALEHHYAVNRHHPEHFEDGIEGMTLLDLLEMLCDWKAASEQQAGGDVRTSLEVGVERFKISRSLAGLLSRTIDELYT